MILPLFFASYTPCTLPMCDFLHHCSPLMFLIPTEIDHLVAVMKRLLLGLIVNVDIGWVILETFVVAD